MTAPHTLGEELGTGLGAFATGFVGTQNTIRQQQEALAQQARDNQYRDQQAAATLTQNAFANDYNNRQLAQQTAYQDGQLASTAATNGADARLRDFAVVGKQYTDEGTRLQTQLQAATAAGDPVLIKHAVDRIKRLNSLMSAVNLSTHDDNYWDAKKNLVEFMGGTAAPDSSTAPAGPAPSPAAAQTPAAPPPMDYSFNPAGHGDRVANGDPAQPPTQATPPAAAPAPAPAAPPPASDLGGYTTLNQIPISDLVKMDPTALAEKFGGSDPDVQDSVRTYYYGRKQAYNAAVAEQQVVTQKQRMDDWKVRLTELSKRTDLTPKMNAAIDTLTTLNTLPTLNESQQAQMAAAYRALAPQVYTAASWGDVVKGNNAQQIASMYPVYLAANPSSVSGFDITPYKTLADAAVTKVATEGAGAAHKATLDKYLNGAPDLGHADLPTLVAIQGNPQAMIDFGMTSNDAREAFSQAIINRRNGDTATADNLLAQAQGTGQKNAADADTQARVTALGGASSFTEVAGKGDLTTLAAIQGDPAKMKLLGLDTPEGMQAMTGLITKIKAGDKAATTLAAATLTKMGDDHRASLVTTGGDAYKTATGQLAAFAGTKLSALALKHQNPGLWGSMKRDLGTPGHPLTDSILTALFNDAKTAAGDADAAAKLDQWVKQAQISTSGATTAAIQQTTAFKAIMGGATSLDSVVSAKDSETLRLIAGNQAARQKLGITDNGAHLLNLARQFDDERAAGIEGTRAGTTLAGANTSRVQAETTQITTMTPLNAQNIQGVIAARTEATRQSVALLKGRIGIQNADILKLGADTLYTQTRTPGTAQYIPAIKAGAAGDPNAPVYKEAGAWDAKARLATSQAAGINTQLTSFVTARTPKYTPFSYDSLTPTDKAAYDMLVGKRDALIGQAAGFVQKSDAAMQKLKTPDAAGGGALNIPATKSVALTGLSAPLVQRVNTMFTGFTAPGGLTPIVNQGVRTAAQQDALYAQGRTAPGPIVTNARSGQSLHEAGNAIDISWVDPKTGKILPDSDPRTKAAYKALGARAPQYGLTWGGTFKGLGDLGHFEVNASAGNPTTLGAGTPLPTGTPKPVVAKPAPIPKGLTPIGNVKTFLGPLQASGWFATAASVSDRAGAQAAVERGAKIMMPNASPEQANLLKKELSQTMGW